MREHLSAAALASCCVFHACSRADVTLLSRAGAPGELDAAAPLDPLDPQLDGGQQPARELRFERVLTPDLAADAAGCHLASPIAGGPGILAAAGDSVRGFSERGELRWSTQLPAPDGERALVVATPHLAGDTLLVAYHTVAASARLEVNERRLSQRVAALDAHSGALAPGYENLVLAASFTDASGGEIEFRADHALARSALAGSGEKLLVTFGNARDLQPWHGFAFELDLARWRSSGAQAAISGSLVTTPELDCGALDSSGSRVRRCGGGLWSPAGPLLAGTGDGYVAVLAPGNGRLDLPRRAYANTLLRVRPGLSFDPSCSAACAEFDPDRPSADCVESCRDLFVPRDTVGEPFPEPESGACAGLTLFQCWQQLDYGGGSTPARVRFEGRELLVYPNKDGALYLIDWEHLGTLYDRKQLVAVCGTASDVCRQDWAGMIVTEPLVIEGVTFGGEPVIVVPTFMPDRTHEAGVMGLRLARGARGHVLERAWQYPPQGSPEALSSFREHPSRAAVMSRDGQAIALLVEVLRGDRQGRLLALDAGSGQRLAQASLAGPGYRFTKPLVLGDQVLVPSCDSDAGPSQLELFRLAE
jgi:hypothetical protein